MWHRKISNVWISARVVLGLKKKAMRAKKTRIKSETIVNRCKSGISVRKHPDVCYSLALMDYDSCTIYLGSDVHPDDVEEIIEDTLSHEYIHYVLFKLFGIDISKMYDKIYGKVESRGRVIVF